MSAIELVALGAVCALVGAVPYGLLAWLYHRRWRTEQAAHASRYESDRKAIDHLWGRISDAREECARALDQADERTAGAERLAAAFRQAYFELVRTIPRHVGARLAAERSADVMERQRGLAGNIERAVARFDPHRAAVEQNLYAAGLHPDSPVVVPNTVPMPPEEP